jgi:CBS domain-containing protein
MKRQVVSISASATLSEAAARIATRHIGMLPVVEADGRLVGVLQLRDLLELVLPDFVRLVDDFDFVPDFGAVEGRQPPPGVLARPVREVMQPAISVQENCGLLRAYAIMRRHDLHDLPVVKADGRLVGIASSVDVGAALIKTWRTMGGPAPEAGPC